MMKTSSKKPNTARLTQLLVCKVRKCAHLCQMTFTQARAQAGASAPSATVINDLESSTNELSSLLPQLLAVLKPRVRHSIGTAALRELREARAQRNLVLLDGELTLPSKLDCNVRVNTAVLNLKELIYAGTAGEQADLRDLVLSATDVALSAWESMLSAGSGPDDKAAYSLMVAAEDLLDQVA